MKVKEVIVVEGKNDTAKIKQVVDADTIETNGSCINEETIKLIKKTNEIRGVIIFTDPDYPGQRIRNIINQNVENCKNAFLDKKLALGKNKVGIEHANKDDILKALENTVTFESNKQSLSYTEYIELELIGNSKLRKYVCNSLSIGHCNAKTCFKRLNMINASYEQIKEIIKEYHCD